jgi:hypothetical protein
LLCARNGTAAPRGCQRGGPPSTLSAVVGPPPTRHSCRRSSPASLAVPKPRPSSARDQPSRCSRHCACSCKMSRWARPKGVGLSLLRRRKYRHNQLPSEFPGFHYRLGLCREGFRGGRKRFPGGRKRFPGGLGTAERARDPRGVGPPRLSGPSCALVEQIPCGADDRRCINAEVPVEVFDFADLAEVGDAQARYGGRVDSPEK